MDPFTTLSLAAAVIQIADVGVRLLKTARELYKTGKTLNHEQLLEQARGLRKLVGVLSSTLEEVSRETSSLDQVEQDLFNLCKKMDDVAGELIDFLGSFGTADAKNRSWAALLGAFSYVSKAKKASQIMDSLEKLRNDLVLRIMVTIKLKDNKLREDKQRLISVLGDERYEFMEKSLKEVVDSLLSSKSFFTTGVEEVLREQKNERREQAEERRQAQIRYEETIAAIATLRPSDLTQFEEGSDRLTENSVKGLSVIQRGVLELLWFPFIQGRRSDVSDHYESTFQWAHESEEASVSYPKQDRLASWLETGKGCFWINGKAGSGKSTFMKYLVGKNDTAKLLGKWAGANPLLCPSFFFWSSGSLIQKSQEGLFRSILYECLSHHPELIPIVFPIRCRQVSRGLLSVHEPSLTELKDAFKLLIEQTLLPLSICFFVDGIDEYSGDHMQVIEFLRSLSSPTRKLVLSSRPTTACANAFTECDSIRLQDLTQDDIRQFIEGNLFSSSKMEGWVSRDDSVIKSLREEIAKKASGVFLWVVLVVKSLNTAILNGDKINDLRKRVDTLPTDLDRLYQAMFSQMDPVYKRQASMVLQIMYRSVQVSYDCPMTVLKLSFALEDNPRSAVDAESRELTTEGISQRCRNIHRFIASRCCGLVEMWRPLSEDQQGIPKTHDDIMKYYEVLFARNFDRAHIRDDEVELLHQHIESTTQALQYHRNLPEAEVGPDSEVHFLHKSVVDFLEKPGIWAELVKLTNATDFDATISLVSSSLHEIKTTPVEFREIIDKSLIWRSLIKGLHECALAEPSTSPVQDILLRELDCMMDYHWRQADGWHPNYGRSLEEMGHWSHMTPTSVVELKWEYQSPPYDSMFAMACRFGLKSFVQAALEKERDGIDSSRWCLPTDSRHSLAQAALYRIIGDIGESQSSPSLWRGQLEILKLSLEHGADVNIPGPGWYGFSAWHVALLRCSPRDFSGCQDWSEVIHMMISYGADLVTPVATEVFNEEPCGERDATPLQKPLGVILERYSIAESLLDSRTARYQVKALSDGLRRALLLQIEKVWPRIRDTEQSFCVSWSPDFRCHELRAINIDGSRESVPLQRKKGVGEGKEKEKEKAKDKGLQT